MPRPPDAATLADLKAVVGRGAWLESAADVAPYLEDFRGLFRGATPLVLQPRNLEEVARVLRICSRDEVAIVPQGGNTGYCGAATPDASGSQIVLSMRRLNRIREVDSQNFSLLAEAGCTLAAVQAAAQAADRLFPLSLGSEGSAQIGGNLATNAGGTAVLRYGMMRDLVLGLEVVLADGRVLAGLQKLRKDNTGYDVKSLFIGSEGTLGVITAASLKLYPRPADSATALVGVESPRRALELLARLRAAAADALTSFELLPRRAVELTVDAIDGVANPLADAAPWYVLVEIDAAGAGSDAAASLTAELEAAAAADAIGNALIASSLAQAESMWKLRESVPAAQRLHGASLKHDLSVPLSALPDLIERGTALVERLVPDGETIAYGHLGDGNLHFNVSQMPGTDRAAFLARQSALEEALFDLAESLGGSFSAEHGIGRLRVAQLARRADPVELALMRELKRALDPKGILNPGKVLA
ncbi:MAG TPA: FAD-binding oxidoreductase [Steroidobacteraceae bacterium]|nr:FAD-binding oxidoreductase [Steroidobacteraceae bacterium]